MINIAYQDGKGQYDESGNQITHWDEKRCSWIVNKPYIKDYKNGNINWYGEDNDFARGTTKEEYQNDYPGANNFPDITLRVEFSQEGFKKGFPGENSSNYPNGYSYHRYWGYLDYSFEESKRLVNYLPCNIHADKITLTWSINGKKNNQIVKNYVLVRENDTLIESKL